MKDKKEIDLEKYGEEPKESFLKTLWNKTVFPDKIKAKREQREWENNLRRTAREQAKPEIEQKLIEKFKQEEIDKMTQPKNKSGKLKNFGEKLAKGFAMPSDGSGKKDIGAMMGMGGSGPKDIGAMMGMGRGVEEPVERKPRGRKSKKKKTTKKKTIKQKENKINSFEDKIKRMLE